MIRGRVQVTGLEEVKREFADIYRNQLPFAEALMLTGLAQDVQKAIQQEVLPDNFILRHVPWMKANIRITPATKQKLESSVRDTYAAMQLQEAGGQKYPAFGKMIAVPIIGGAKTSARALVPPELLPHNVMAMGGFIVGLKSGAALMLLRQLHVTKRRAIKGGFGGQTTSTWSREAVPMYLLLPSAPIKPRYGFEKSAEIVVGSQKQARWQAAAKRAIRTMK